MIDSLSLWPLKVIAAGFMPTNNFVFTTAAATLTVTVVNKPTKTTTPMKADDRYDLFISLARDDFMG